VTRSGSPDTLLGRLRSLRTLDVEVAPVPALLADRLIETAIGAVIGMAVLLLTRVVSRRAARAER
jgi:hypothetical protein